MSELRNPKSPRSLGLVNGAGFGASATTRRFQAASAAFIHPARKPTRRSGAGAAVDVFSFEDVAHAATTVPIASKRDVDLTGDSVEGRGRLRRAFGSSGRSRPPD